MSTALVTGAAEFIGSHVAEHCHKQGMNVVGVDDLSGGFAENLPNDIPLVDTSVTDSEAVDKLWRDHGPFEFVYHLAAYAAEGLSHFIRKFNYTNNVIGSVNLLNAAVRNDCRCFVFTSSIAVYGSAQVPMTEDTVPRPLDPYGIAKYAVELDLAAAHTMFGIDYVIFRPHNVYGERQNIADPYRNVIGIFMAQALKGQSMPIFGDGSQTRAFTYIDDVAPIIASSPLISGARNRVFNIGADAAYSVRELAEKVSSALDVRPNIKFLPPRHEAQYAFSTHDALREVFSPPPPVELDSGLERMASWVRGQPQREPVPFPSIELTRGLPPSWASM
jgi:UDP-glucose 4-epimerase